MAHTLETLELGTPVFCGDLRVGEVHAIYAEGGARAVEWVIVGWAARGDVAVPAFEVETVDDRGVLLMHHDPKLYADLTDFSEARFPTARRLA